LGAEEDRRQADEEARRLHEWAEREKKAGNLDKAARLHAKAEIVHRHYGSGQRNPIEYDDRGASPSGGSPGCLLVCILVVLAMAPAVAWPILERLA
jgi:hypothetical protein